MKGSNYGFSQPTSHRLTFSYLFLLYFILGGAETMISPLFPLLRAELDLDESHQAALLGVVAAGIASFNIIGGASARWFSDRSQVRLAAVCLSAGMLISGTAGSFPQLLIGQAFLGIAFGLFFPPALAAIARLFPGSQGKAIAVYGLAYSFGLAAAALTGNVGEDGWRLVFYVSAVPAIAAVVWTPHWLEPEHDPSPLSLITQLREYTRSNTYRLAGFASFGGVSMHYVVIGFSPVYFVDKDVSLGLVAGLIAAGRILSAPVKLGGGILYDRFGGPWTARLMMTATTLVGVPLMLLPAHISVYLLVPFVGVAVSILPVANAMLVASLPAHSGWGIGTFRAALLGSAAVLSGIISILLQWIQIEKLMLSSLVIPALVALAMHLSAKANTGRSGEERKET